MPSVCHVLQATTPLPCLCQVYAMFFRQQPLCHVYAMFFRLQPLCPLCAKCAMFCRQQPLCRVYAMFCRQQPLCRINANCMPCFAGNNPFAMTAPGSSNPFQDGSNGRVAMAQMNAATPGFSQPAQSGLLPAPLMPLNPAAQPMQPHSNYNPFL